MIGVHRGRLANWCANNIDLLVVTCGALILGYIEVFGIYLNSNPPIDYGFLALLLGVITLSVGIAALICYRLLLKLHGLL